VQTPGGRGDDERPPDYRSPRRVQEPAPSARTETQRDRDRILYSSAFNRLAGITQVASSAPGASFHNRLTHSFKVAQVARRLAERLKDGEADVELVDRLDVDAAEAAALGHDLGHPPFGHLAEEILADAMRDAGGFEGNAQSFRIVCRLAMRDPEHPGLNLTPATLNGMLKYPWLAGEHPTDPNSTKFGAYWSDREDFLAAQGKSSVRPGQRTLEAELMDWSDDITYAVHDLEDFYRVGLVPLERLRTNGDERARFFESFFKPDGSLRSKFDGADPGHLRDRLDLLFLGRLVFDPFVGTSTQRAQLRQASSTLIGDFMGAISASVSAEQAQTRVVRIDRDAQADVLILKELMVLRHQPPRARAHPGGPEGRRAAAVRHLRAGRAPRRAPRVAPGPRARGGRRRPARRGAPAHHLRLRRRPDRAARPRTARPAHRLTTGHHPRPHRRVDSPAGRR
jgi:dGTPase